MGYGELNVGDYVELLGNVVGSITSLEAIEGTAFGMVKVP